MFNNPRRVLAQAVGVTTPFFFLPDGWLDKGEDWKRVLKFYSIAFPAYLHYELVDRLYPSPIAQREVEFKRLHDRYSPIMQANVLQMRGFFLKAAQLMSVRDDFLPPQYLEWTRRMQNEAPITFSSDEARAIVAAELGSNFSKLSDWEDTPVGSASIGQVYRARYAGAVVAVKVQSPDAERLFKSDLSACKFFCKFALPHLLPSLDEIERQFQTEFDYTLEGANLAEIGDNVRRDAGLAKRVVVPRTICATKNVLIMDYVEGRKLSDVLAEYLQLIAERRGQTVEEAMESLKAELMKQGLTDLRTRQIGWGIHRLVNFFTRFGHTTGPADLINPVSLLKTVMDVHGYQIFVNRTFNGDPHPGNLLLYPDGRVGLVDFGQVKRLSQDRVKQIAKLVIALNKEDKEEVVKIAIEMGCESVRNDPDVIYKLTAFWLDRDTPDITEGMSIHKFLQEMEKRDPQTKLCQDLVMVSRCSVMLRSLGLLLGMRVRTSDYWRPYAEAFLERGDGTKGG